MSLEAHQIEGLLEVLFLTPTADGFGAPAMFWGSPGTSKTFRIRDFCKSRGIPLQVLSPGLHGEGAFGVVPIPVQDQSGTTHLAYPSPSWTRKFEEHGDPIPGLVFVDEITTAQPAVTPPLLGLIQERRVGDHYLGSNVRVIAAGNPPSEAAAGWDLPMPVANRMAHFDWPTPNAQQWGNHMMTKTHPLVEQHAKRTQKIESNIEALEKKVLSAWPANYARSAGLVSAFTHARPDALYKKPNENDPNASRAWPSLRSWELAVHAMTTAEILGRSPADVDTLISGFVGSAAATEFVAFRLMADLPNPEDLLDGRVKFVHNPTRLDRTMAVLSACAAFIIPESTPKRDDRADVFAKIVETSCEGAIDVAIPAMRVVLGASGGKLAMRKSFAAITAKLKPLLIAAGFEKK